MRGNSGKLMEKVFIFPIDISLVQELTVQWLQNVSD